MKDQDIDVPLYVDLDGTLLRSDSLLESALQLIKKSLLFVFMLPLWVMKGPAHLKRQIVQHITLPYELLPYNEKIIGFLIAEKQKGRRIVLATAANAAIAQGVNDHLHIFDEVMGSDAQINLKSRRKLAAILARQAGAPFDYIGDSWADRPMLEKARRVFLVNPGWFLIRFVKQLGKPVEIIRDTALGPIEFVRSIRLYQWLKNGLIFVPLFTSHHWFDSQRLTLSVLGFVSFSLCASSIYLLNDIFDLEADRRHPKKRFRPLARGAMSIQSGIAWSAVFLSVGLTLAGSLSTKYFLLTCGYIVLTTAYTLFLKRVVLVDAVVLAVLYTARIIGGAFLIDVPLSFWLLAFSMFIFLSLSLVKRCSELVTLQELHQSSSRGRDYRVTDLPALQMVGLGSGFMAVLVVALFVNDPAIQALYSRHQLLWLLCPLFMYWVGRMWLKTARGEMDSDPIVFALKDRASVLIFTLIVLVVLAAT